MSAGVTGANALLTGVSQYEAGQTRARLLTANQGIAAAQAASEVATGNYNANAVLMRGAAMKGQQIATIGANGLQQGGTNATVVADTSRINELDALQTRNNALRRAWGFQVQGASDAFQAKEASTAGDLSGLGGILSGGGKAYTQFNDTGRWF